jgi:hypothetical protein
LVGFVGEEPELRAQARFVSSGGPRGGPCVLMSALIETDSNTVAVSNLIG